MAFSLEEINYRTVADPKGMIEEADEIYEQKIAKAARMILENRKKSPIVLLSGPSGSGKTTTAMKISRALEERGVRTHYVAMDDYFNTVRPETVPRTPEGEMDLESPLCLDMELLNSHFTELAQGKRIYVPKYEFSRQMRIQEPSKSIKLKKDEIVVFEGFFREAGSGSCAARCGTICSAARTRIRRSPCGPMSAGVNKTTLPPSWTRRTISLTRLSPMSCP